MIKREGDKTIKLTTREYYSLQTMWDKSLPTDDDHAILRDWYNGEISEVTAVNKLKKLDKVNFDTLVEEEYNQTRMVNAVRKNYQTPNDMRITVNPFRRVV